MTMPTMSDSTKTTTGWILFITAMGMMSTLLSAEVAGLQTWHQVSEPQFVAKVLAHLGVVIASFVGGKLIPNN